MWYVDVHFELLLPGKFLGLRTFIFEDTPACACRENVYDMDKILNIIFSDCLLMCLYPQVFITK